MFEWGLCGLDLLEGGFTFHIGGADETGNRLLIPIKFQLNLRYDEITTIPLRSGEAWHRSGSVRTAGYPDRADVVGFEVVSCTSTSMCASSPCAHGSCIDGCLQYACVCPDEWFGTECEHPNPCFPNPCPGERQVCRQEFGEGGTLAHVCDSCEDTLTYDTSTYQAFSNGLQEEKICSTTCGDFPDLGEQCDDGNFIASDVGRPSCPHCASLLKHSLLFFPAGLQLPHDRPRLHV
eukprot:SAG31_NODE_218_length_19934_cov_81.634837_6_plen_235_part_00